MINSLEPLRVYDVRHQRNGQIKIVSSDGIKHIANVLASGPDPEGYAALFAAAPQLVRSLTELVELFTAADPAATFNVPERYERAVRLLEKLAPEATS